MKKLEYKETPVIWNLFAKYTQNKNVVINEENRLVIFYVDSNGVITGWFLCGIGEFSSVEYLEKV